MNQDNKNNEKVDLRSVSKDSNIDGIEFHEDKTSRSHYSKETPKIIQWTIKYSGELIKNKKQANYVLLGFVILAVIISLFLFFSGGTDIPKGAIENPEYGLPIID